MATSLLRRDRTGAGDFDLRNKRTGFTLIELLVVIAIIAILAAILFPVFTSVKKRAWTTACSSNVKQLSQSVLMYVDDYSGWLPPAFNEPTGGKAWSWRWAVMGYVKDRKIWVCPAFKATDITPQQWNGDTTTCIDDIGSSYGINMNISGNSSQSPVWAGSKCHKATEYMRHSRTLLLMECQEGFFYPYFDLLMKGKDDYIHRLFPVFHQRKMIVSFLDGHARHMYIRDTLSTNPNEFMWCDIKPGDSDTIARIQNILRLWPRDYPPNGN